VDEGDDVAVAASSSTSFSVIVGNSVTKASPADARISVATLRRLSCVFLSASSLADVAPTPKTMPAVVGGVMRARMSNILSLSLVAHCRSSGSHALWTRPGSDPKNLASANASAMSFLHAF
jgi:hypothetical protein